MSERRFILRLALNRTTLIYTVVESEIKRTRVIFANRGGSRGRGSPNFLIISIGPGETHKIDSPRVRPRARFAVQKFNLPTLLPSANIRRRVARHDE